MIIIKHTNELKPNELVEIFKQRTAVFVVEQNCPYPEVDDDDFNDLHVCLVENGNLQAYARIIDKKTHITFGRVLVVKKFRGSGLGKEIVAATLKEITQRFPNVKIRIQAQTYLQDFYSSFGFKTISETYLEDGIPHIDMILK
ncbi:GNAT family N-acetyltransferase [Companilactobacillus sp. HBUAS56257]|uniref:GNAT family N-acetyltransferase n=1 Tax=Companilactobacillus sp. HBUAS56257 TaxID=3109360 RepID=UPI002FF14899